MTTASDNVFPKVILQEAAAPSSPAATQFKLYVDSSDHLLKYKNSAGTVTTLGTGYTPGGTDVAVADGGTGASTASGARTNLGLVLGTDVASLTAGVVPIAQLATGTPTGSKFIRDDGTLQVPAGGGGGSTGARYPVQDAASGSASSTTRTVTFGTAPTNGNKLIIVTFQEGTNAVTSIVQTNVAWSKLAGTTIGTAPVVEIWVGVVSASAGTGAVVTFAGTSFCNAHGSEWTGLTGTLDQNAQLHTTTGATGAHLIPIITPTSVTALVVAGATTTNNTNTFSGFSGVSLMQFPADIAQTGGAYFGFPGTNPIYGSAAGGSSATASMISVSIT